MGASRCGDVTGTRAANGKREPCGPTPPAAAIATRTASAPRRVALSGYRTKRSVRVVFGLVCRRGPMVVSNRYQRENPHQRELRPAPRRARRQQQQQQHQPPRRLRRPRRRSPPFHLVCVVPPSNVDSTTFLLRVSAVPGPDVALGRCCQAAPAAAAITGAPLRHAEQPPSETSSGGQRQRRLERHLTPRTRVTSFLVVPSSGCSADFVPALGVCIRNRIETSDAPTVLKSQKAAWNST